MQQAYYSPKMNDINEGDDFDVSDYADASYTYDISDFN